MGALFQPLALRDVALPNRIVISPMCQYSAIDGSATDWHLVNLGHLALSGPGLAFFEATHVSPEARITTRCLGLYSDENEAGIARVVRFLREHAKSPIGIQLAHAGRKGSTLPPWEGGGPAHGAQAWEPVAPSPLAYKPDWAVPRTLDAGGIRKVRDDFVAAAQRAQRIGIDVIELHFAHGYLAHQFLSPLSNVRDDHYGGSLENRMRFPLELFDAVRAVWPSEKPLGVRISATDYVEGGWTLDEAIVFVRALAARGCDFIDVSSGGLSPLQKIDPAPGYQVPFARTIRAESHVPVIAVGMITSPLQAENIVAAGDADMVALARGFLRHPRWTWDAADQLGAETYCPPQYLRGRKP
jgi:NADPH2 dehydrogenase